ncbi:MAG: helix-turn-helix domain-containing protein [Acidimicrobiales bacterium]
MADPTPRTARAADAAGRELRARGRKTRRRLLDAGIDVFARRGFHAARVDDIVKAAKTSHGTFYLYFSNKEALFAALVADVADEMADLAASLEPITADAAGREALRAWLSRFSELYERYGPILRTWTEAEIDQSELGRMGTDLLGELAVALAAQLPAPKRAKARDRIDNDVAALALVAMIERFNYFVLSGQVGADRDAMLDTLADSVHDAVFGAAAEHRPRVS